MTIMNGSERVSLRARRKTPLPFTLHASLFTLFSLLLLPLLSTYGHAALEREQMVIESQIKTRIEDVLSKTLPPNSYLVNVKVEM
jgi:hypothetical protein